MKVVIDSLAYGGNGIATLDDGRTAFVSGSCPGDVVEIDILSDHGRYVKAVVKSVIQPSNHNRDVIFIVKEFLRKNPKARIVRPQEFT